VDVAAARPRGFVPFVLFNSNIIVDRAEAFACAFTSCPSGLHLTESEAEATERKQASKQAKGQGCLPHKRQGKRRRVDDDCDEARLEEEQAGAISTPPPSTLSFHLPPLLPHPFQSCEADRETDRQTDRQREGSTEQGGAVSGHTSEPSRPRVCEW
jgi:hypothetical protein